MTLILLLTLLACHPPVADDSGEPPLADTAETGAEPEDTAVEPEEAFLSGEVEVALYAMPDGRVQGVAWEDLDTDFFFGDLHVMAYLRATDGELTWLAGQTIRNPSPQGNRWDLIVTAKAEEEILVVAALDYWGDGILDRWDPIGLARDVLPMPVDGSAEEIPPLQVWAATEDGGPCYTCYGCGPAHSCEQVTVAGSVSFDAIWDGAGQALLMGQLAGDDTCRALWHVEVLAVTATEDGWLASYDAQFCTGMQVEMRVGVDTDLDGLVSPVEPFGGLAGATPEYTLTLEEEDVAGVDLQVPLEGAGLFPEPVLDLTVQVPSPAGTFDAWLTGLGADPERASLMVVASALPLEGDVSVDQVAEALAWRVFALSELTGLSSLESVLRVPPHTTLHLLALVDLDGNGVLREVDEPVASYGGSAAELLETGFEDLSIDLAF